MVATKKPKTAVVGELPIDTDELIERLGGSELLLKRFEEHGERSRRLAGMVPELTEQYPDQWAALPEGGELVIAPSLDELVTKLRAMGARPGSNVIEFLDTEPERWLL